jgi:hypothetical protein
MATAAETGATTTETKPIELSPEDQALLNTQFPPEIEKEAEAKLLALDAVSALREYGAARAEDVLLSYGEEPVSEEDGIKKIAAAGEEIERYMKLVRANNYAEESQLDEKELTEVLTKEAQACAHAINDGFWDEVASAYEANPDLVKEAAKMGFMKKMKGHAGAAVKGAKNLLHKGMSHAEHAAHMAKKYGKKHGAAAAAGAAVGAAGGAAAAHHASK